MKKTILLVITILLSMTVSAQSISSFVKEQMSKYPKSRLLDLYKSCFQDYMGAEHLVSDTESVRRYLDYELSTTKTEELQPCYYEPCGINGNYVRISIRTIKEGLITKDKMLDAFIRSANSAPRPSVESWKQRWHKIADSIDVMNLQLPHYAEDHQYIDSILSAGEYAISHSPDYREAYHPHYRIVSREIFENEIKPLITRRKGSPKTK